MREQPPHHRHHPPAGPTLLHMCRLDLVQANPAPTGGKFPGVPPIGGRGAHGELLHNPCRCSIDDKGKKEKRVIVSAVGGPIMVHLSRDSIFTFDDFHPVSSMLYSSVLHPPVELTSLLN